MSMADAVSRLVRPGMTIVAGAGLEASIPFAAGHEIIRQQKKDLCVISPISDTFTDVLVGGGVVGKVIAAWVGNVSTGLGYNFKRAVEKGIPNPLEMIDHSNLSVATALDAGAMGVPFGIMRSLVGTDIQKDNPDFKETACPFTGEKVLAVRALRPDLAVIHAQRADEAGNTHLWGSLGVTLEAVKAARQVLVVVEEIVDPGVIRSDPNRTLIPGFKVGAVVLEPGGAHPAPVQGYYGHDGDFYVDYARATKDIDNARAWFDEWVYGVKDRKEYLEKIGRARMESLQVKNSAPAAVVEYGF